MASYPSYPWIWPGLKPVEEEKPAKEAPPPTAVWPVEPPKPKLTADAATEWVRRVANEPGMGAKELVRRFDEGKMNHLTGDERTAYRAAAMGLLSQQTIDPFDTMIKEASLAMFGEQRRGSRQKSFVNGPRGVEGPLANMIFGGGTSRMGA